ncbi:MAG: hypothetical protein JNM57_15690 [Cyclobacteriaceae bacterium]|nr:hypothetical protein [Cyclobacteriaceae bacterium]
MKAFFTSIVLTLISIAALAQLGAKTQGTKIYGTWQNNSFGYQMTLILNTDGSGEFDGEVIKFSTQANTLSITQSGTKTNYSFNLQNNSLTVSGGDLDQPITFIRSGTNSEGATVITQQSTSSVSNPQRLIGVWSNYGESIEFQSNNQCIYQSRTFPYTASGNQITLQTTQGNVTMGYTVDGNELSLTINGQNFVYIRGNAAPGTGNANKTTSGNKNLDLSLVGKWCYVNVTSTNSGGTSSDECITINANGTYEYYSERSMSVNTNAFAGGTNSQSSDRGTWWIEGDRIHYTSQSQGPGSYQLQKRNHPKNGDPMIILDGTTYVTYYQKAPW